LSGIVPHRSRDLASIPAYVILYVRNNAKEKACDGRRPTLDIGILGTKVDILYGADSDVAKDLKSAGA